MTGPPDARPGCQTAPPIKRANPCGIPVRLSNGALVAHVTPELAGRLLDEGAAESLRSGSRRYLRLRQGNHHSAHGARVGGNRIPPQVAWRQSNCRLRLA
jgi:hypothetical protein